MSSRVYRNIGNLSKRVMKNEQQNPISQDDDVIFLVISSLN